MLKKPAQTVQIIKNKLYWYSSNEPPKHIHKAFYFNIDNDLIYDPFNNDFGPLSLGKTWKYVIELEKLRNHPDYQTTQIYHYTSTDPEKSVNAAYLICAYQIISLKMTAKTAYQPFKKITFKPFRDAGYADCSYKCTLLDCLRGLQYAIRLGWFNYKSFNLAEYEHYQKVENGDLNWIVPHKFIAFSSPNDKPIDKYGNRVLTPNDYVPVFKKLGVKTVVRLNNKMYQANDFIKQGINHHQLFFPDGSVPSFQIVQKFLKVAESQPGAMAIHCKAGLGRTGTLIGLYVMKHYGFPAADFIGWIRIARPGSILGPQQNYLVQMQGRMRELGADSAIWKQVRELVDEQQIECRMNMNLSDLNKRELQIMKHGEKGQGEGLVNAKMKKSSLHKTPSMNKANSRQFRSYSKSSSSSGGKSPIFKK